MLDYATCSSGSKTLIIRSQRVIAGKPSNLSPASSAINSASVDECDTAPCFLQSQVIGQNVCGPTRHNSTPEVDFESFKSPANDASQKSMSLHLLGASPIQLRITEFLL